jgi:hypothetical protein
MAFRLHFVEDVLNLSIRTDDESRPRHAHDFLAIHILFLNNSEGFADFLAGIAQQGERQAELFLELFLVFGLVGRNSEQYRSGFLHLLIRIAELTDLDGAAGSVGSRIKEEYNVFPAQVFE